MATTSTSSALLLLLFFCVCSSREALAFVLHKKSTVGWQHRAAAAAAAAAADDDDDDYAAAGGEKEKASSLGDLAGGMETTMEYLPDFTPLERIALTATGNLQRIISSYYNCPVTVECVKNVKVAAGVYDREVKINVIMKTDEEGNPSPVSTAMISEHHNSS
jgi:hypothetical protein